MALVTQVLATSYQSSFFSRFGDLTSDREEKGFAIFTIDL
jgi:hypothetical protein